MYVAAELKQVIVGIDQDSFEPPLIEVADPVVAPVKRCCVADVEVPHELRKISLRSLYDHMKVVAHEHIRVHADLIDPDGRFQFIEKDRPVAFIGEDVFPLIAPASHMIKSAWIINPQWPRHDPSFLRQTNQTVKSKDLTLTSPSPALCPLQ
jgi:hypothetical protein